MPNYITQPEKCPHTNLEYRINKLTACKNPPKFFIHYFNPQTSEFLFSWEV